MDMCFAASLENDMGFMRFCWLGLAGVCGITTMTPATAAEFRVYGGRWDYRVSGFVDDHGTRTDLNSDLGVGTEHDGFLSLEYEHRPSWLPDLGLNYAQLSGFGSRTTSGTPIGPITLPTGSTRTTASGDFRDLDVAARYAIALGPIRFSPGVTLKWLKGHVVTRDESSGQQTDQPYDELFPMVHAQIVWSFGDRLHLSAQGNWISRGGDQAYEYGGSAELRLLGPLGLYGGWTEKRYKINGGGFLLDARLRGPRYGLLVVF